MPLLPAAALVMLTIVTAMASRWQQQEGSCLYSQEGQTLHSAALRGAVPATLKAASGTRPIVAGARPGAACDAVISWQLP